LVDKLRHFEREFGGFLGTWFWAITVVGLAVIWVCLVLMMKQAGWF